MDFSLYSRPRTIPPNDTFFYKGLSWDFKITVIEIIVIVRGSRYPAIDEVKINLKNSLDERFWILSYLRLQFLILPFRNSQTWNYLNIKLTESCRKVEDLKKLKRISM